MQAPNTQPLALSSETGPVLLRAHEQDPGLYNRSYKAYLRQQLVAVLNAAIRQGQSPDRAVLDTNAELALGISYVNNKKGMDGILEYVNPDKLGDIVAIGRKLKQTYLQEPVEEIRQHNILNREEILSSVVADGITTPPEVRIQLVSHEFNETVVSDLCDDFRKLWNAREEAKTLERALEIANELALDNEMVQRCKGSKGGAIESGLVQLLRHTEGRISYLEVAVFNAVFAHRHGLEQSNPLTFPAKVAKTFSRETGSDYNLSDNALSEYEQACVEVFPTHAHESWVLLQRYLESVGEYARHEQIMARGTLSPELFFPVEKYTQKALGKKKRR